MAAEWRVVASLLVLFAAAVKGNTVTTLRSDSPANTTAAPPRPIQTVAISERFIDFTEYQERVIQPSTWICAEYDNSRPDVAHEALLGYRNGENAEGIVFEAVETYPLMRIENAIREDLLCLFLDPQKFCYPPEPTASGVTVYETPITLRYAALRFYGHVSDERYEHYKNALRRVVETNPSQPYDFDSIYLSYYDGHTREIRVNAIESYESPCVADC